ncbi:MAG: hypothetical protein IKS31_12540 [Clostridia bacterium]|nr:hypothetical protein [Clostridia bacterium]MBR4459779.1 hypothetical protein [Clostridia bacterium]
MERFLQYSLSHDRPIRLIIQEDDGRLRQVSAVVEERGEGGVRLYILRPPRRITLPEDRILAASYVPKDEGLAE